MENGLQQQGQRPYRCRNDRQPWILTGVRLTACDRLLLKKLGDGNMTQGIERLLDEHRRRTGSMR